MASLSELFRNYPGYSATVLLSVWLASVFWILHPLSRSRLAGRVSVVLTLPHFCLLLAAMALPKALNGLFQFVLGHSIYARNMAGTRWIETWDYYCSLAFICGVALGTLIALINIGKGREAFLNLIALGAGSIWLFLMSGFLQPF